MFARRQPSPQPAAADDDVGTAVLGFLRSQGLAPTPLHYELGYRWRTAPNGLVARAVDAVVLAGGRMTPADAARILAGQHERDGGGEEEARSAVRHHTLRLAEAAAGAAEATGRFGRELGERLDGLERADAPVSAIVAAMIERAAHAEQRLTETAEQVHALRAELEAARGDAARDALTGLLNRRGLRERLKAAGARGRERGSLAICDVDHFKSINDRHGHPVGDRVLKAVAASLAEACEPHPVARWGGEEFVVVLHGASVERAARLVDGARAALADKRLRVRETGEPLGGVTFSAGVAPLDNGRLDEAIAAADARLYRAKAAGRNRVVTTDG